MRIPRELLRESITVEDYTGAGAHGPQYSAGRVIRASMQDRKAFEKSRDNTVVVRDTLAMIRPEDGPVAPQSRITWGTEKFRVETCYAMPDTRRPSHYELSLTRFVG